MGSECCEHIAELEPILLHCPLNHAATLGEPSALNNRWWANKRPEKGFIFWLPNQLRCKADWMQTDSPGFLYIFFLTLFFFFFFTRSSHSPLFPPLSESAPVQKSCCAESLRRLCSFFLAGCWCSLICTLFIAGTHTGGKSCLELTVSKVKWIWLLASVVGDQGFHSDTYFWFYYKNCF